MSTEIIPFADVKVGDVLDGPNGTVTVTKVYEEHLPDTMFAIELDNGETIECSGTHLWYAETRDDRAYSKRYYKLLRAYLAANIPLVQNDCYITKEQAVASFGPKHEEFICRLCDTVGPVSSRPEVILDLYYETTHHIEELYYSYKTLSEKIKYLRHCKQPKFFIGKVRTTLDLFRYETEIEIPEGVNYARRN